MSRCGPDTTWDEAKRNWAASGPQSAPSRDLGGHARTHASPCLRRLSLPGATTLPAFLLLDNSWAFWQHFSHIISPSPCDTVIYKKYLTFRGLNSMPQMYLVFVCSSRPPGDFLSEGVTVTMVSLVSSMRQPLVPTRGRERGLEAAEPTTAGGLVKRPGATRFLGERGRGRMSP